eukprot:m.308990 g.308990  ORF g.308990 m.308990 type:complete len:717 (-) comp55335_c0_seq2:139-2289(-)
MEFVALFVRLAREGQVGSAELQPFLAESHGCVINRKQIAALIRAAVQQATCTTAAQLSVVFQHFLALNTSLTQLRWDFQLFDIATRGLISASDALQLVSLSLVNKFSLSAWQAGMAARSQGASFSLQEVELIVCEHYCHAIQQTFVSPVLSHADIERESQQYTVPAVTLPKSQSSQTKELHEQVKQSLEFQHRCQTVMATYRSLGIPSQLAIGGARVAYLMRCLILSGRQEDAPVTDLEIRLALMLNTNDPVFQVSTHVQQSSAFDLENVLSHYNKMIVEGTVEAINTRDLTAKEMVDYIQFRALFLNRPDLADLSSTLDESKIEELYQTVAVDLAKKLIVSHSDEALYEDLVRTAKTSKLVDPLITAIDALVDRAGFRWTIDKRVSLKLFDQAEASLFASLSTTYARQQRFSQALQAFKALKSFQTIEGTIEELRTDFKSFCDTHVGHDREALGRCEPAFLAWKAVELAHLKLEFRQKTDLILTSSPGSLQGTPVGVTFQPEERVRKTFVEQERGKQAWFFESTSHQPLYSQLAEASKEPFELLDMLENEFAAERLVILASLGYPHLCQPEDKNRAATLVGWTPFDQLEVAFAKREAENNSKLALSPRPLTSMGRMTSDTAEYTRLLMEQTRAAGTFIDQEMARQTLLTKQRVQQRKEKQQLQGDNHLLATAMVVSVSDRDQSIESKLQQQRNTAADEAKARVNRLRAQRPSISS